MNSNSKKFIAVLIFSFIGGALGSLCENTYESYKSDRKAKAAAYHQCTTSHLKTLEKMYAGSAAIDYDDAVIIATECHLNVYGE